MNAVSTQDSPDLTLELSVLVGFVVGVLLLGAATLRRRTP